MSIAFFSEASFVGKVSRNNPNMRTDQAWLCALDATHYPVTALPLDHYDVGIVIIPKEQNREKLAQVNYPLIEKVKKICTKAYVMQESTHWDWQDESFASMVWYYTQLTLADGILCHNDIDVPYFNGITDKPSIVMPTLMIEDCIKISDEKLDRVFVAGNWHSTYRGFDAWIIGSEFDLPMYGFRSGKFKQGEEENGINYLPWMQWSDFMFELSKCKYGVQTYQASAGQFPLNCAYLGIPCIGYSDINTQKDLHPSLSVSRGDVAQARKLALKLKFDHVFYEKCVEECVFLYKKSYSENIFVEKMKSLL